MFCKHAAKFPLKNGMAIEADTEYIFMFDALLIEFIKGILSVVALLVVDEVERLLDILLFAHTDH